MRSGSPPRRYKAIVFDMDGVLADSEPVYYAALNAVLEPLGKHLTDEQHTAIMGHGVDETWQALAAELGLTGPLDGLIRQYDRELCERLARLTEPLPGVRRLVAELKRRNFPRAVASSSWPGWIEALLGGIGLAGAFDALVSATMVEHAKPAPDLYLLAAAKLSADPATCIAIEDTPTGIKAAKAAGMLAVQVRSASTAFPPLPMADIVLDSLETFDLGLLAGPSH